MSEALYDLAVPRTVVLADRARTYTLHCRRIQPEDWAAYFAAIRVESEQAGRDKFNTVDIVTPRLQLAHAVLTGAEGYTVQGGAELASLPGWQTKVPYAHRLKLGETLADVRAVSAFDEDEGFVIHPEAEVVALEATWTALPRDVGFGPLSMVRLSGLKHFLRSPTEEQHRRYTRESSRSRAVGGSRTGKTIFQGAQPLLAKLYDELAVSVEGYAVDGVPLTGDRAVIVREMDTLHKVMAAQELFQPSNAVALAESEELFTVEDAEAA